jgi:hypothetical protein
MRQTGNLQGPRDPRPSGRTWRSRDDGCRVRDRRPKTASCISAANTLSSPYSKKSWPTAARAACSAGYPRQKGFTSTSGFRWGRRLCVRRGNLLISSCEGLRGDPKNRPAVPGPEGVSGFPTSVNNVETLVVARIMEKGAAWLPRAGSRERQAPAAQHQRGCTGPGSMSSPSASRSATCCGRGRRKRQAFWSGGLGSFIGPKGFDPDYLL